MITKIESQRYCSSKNRVYGLLSSQRVSASVGVNPYLQDLAALDLTFHFQILQFPQQRTGRSRDHDLTLMIVTTRARPKFYHYRWAYLIWDLCWSKGADSLRFRAYRNRFLARESHILNFFIKILEKRYFWFLKLGLGLISSEIDLETLNDLFWPFWDFWPLVTFVEFLTCGDLQWPEH